MKLKFLVVLFLSIFIVQNGFAQQILPTNVQRHTQTIYASKTGEIENTSINFIEASDKFLKICSEISELYKYAKNSEKQDLINYVLQNFFIEGENLRYEYKKPFNMFAEGLSCTKKLPRLSCSFAFNGSTDFLFTSFACSKEKSFALSSLALDFSPRFESQPEKI